MGLCLQQNSYKKLWGRNVDVGGLAAGEGPEKAEGGRGLTGRKDLRMCGSMDKHAEA